MGYTGHIEGNFGRFGHGSKATKGINSSIVAKIKNAMSDRHAAEKAFNKLLTEFRDEILPDILSGWAEATETETEREQLIRMSNFYL